jgi:DNA polymerase-3 subunit gamma/tau
MQGITAAEGIAVDEAALRMIARAAEGSARDSLSLLDQAIAHADGKVEAEVVRAMLGLADRAAVIDLFEEVMRGDIAAGLARLKSLHEVGADPSVVLEDLAAFTHLVTRLKLAAGAEDDDALSEEERKRGKELAGKISLRSLTRTWQMLLKGIDEARAASRPLAAADMVLVRLAHAADLPTPDEALKSMKEGSSVRGETRSAEPPPSNGGPRMATGGGRQGGPAAQPSPSPASDPRAASVPATRLESFADIVAMAGQERDLKLKHALETTVRLVRFEQGQIEVALTEHAPQSLIGELSRKLEQWTGQRWMIAVSRETGARTIEEVRQSTRDQLVSDARADPVVAAVMARFPGAQIVDVRVRADESNPPPVADMPPQNPDEIMDEDD